MAETLKSSKPRIYLWDNVKALLIFAVVMGHFVTQYTSSSEFMRSMFLIIYSFHMPLFIFVSGLFAKSSFKGGELRTNKIISFLILYIALKLVIFFEGVAFGRSTGPFRLFYESGIPWYMLAMAIFICLTYIFRNVKPLVMLIISVLLALICGFDPGVGDILALSRVIVFYPIFLLGYYADGDKILQVSRKPALRIASVLVLVALVVLSFTQLDFLYQFRPLLTGRSPFSKLPILALGPVYRLIGYAVSGIISFAVISVLPNRKNILTYVGASTLPIYFLHRPILYVFMDAGGGKWLMHTAGSYGIYIFLAMSVVLTLILSAKPLKVPFDKLMQYKYGGFFK